MITIVNEIFTTAKKAFNGIHKSAHENLFNAVEKIMSKINELEVVCSIKQITHSKFNKTDGLIIHLNDAEISSLSREIITIMKRFSEELIYTPEGNIQRSGDDIIFHFDSIGDIKILRNKESKRNNFTLHIIWDSKDS